MHQYMVSKSETGYKTQQSKKGGDKRTKNGFDVGFSKK